MSKPKIYGFCEAGCKWEVPHKGDEHLYEHRLYIAYGQTNPESVLAAVRYTMLTTTPEPITNLNVVVEYLTRNSSNKYLEAASGSVTYLNNSYEEHPVIGIYGDVDKNCIVTFYINLNTKTKMDMTTYGTDSSLVTIEDKVRQIF